MLARTTTIALACCVALQVSTPLAAQDAARAGTQANHGFSAQRLQRIDTALQRYVDDGKVAGIVALVLRDGQPVYRAAKGWRDKEADAPMRSDTIFRIASQTKALTSVAILMLMEEGKLGLDDPVTRFIPALGKATVSTVGEDGTARTAPANRPITLRDLLTHTAGLSYGTEPHVAAQYQAKGLGPAAGHGWYTADKDEGTCTSMERLAGLPLVAQPGERFVYGYNTDVLGCVVERASGVALDEYLRTRITAPLGMRDTHFFLPPGQVDRLAAVYGSDDDGKAVRSEEGAKGQGHYVQGPRRNFAGGAGLLSTAADYARFLEMIRNGGAVDGVRLLSPRSAALMHTNMVGDNYWSDGRGFGLGFEVVQRYGADGLVTPGTYGWGGAYGSTYAVDPGEGLVMVLMIQLMPNQTDVQGVFRTLVYQALVAPRVAVP